MLIGIFSPGIQLVVATVVVTNTELDFNDCVNSSSSSNFIIMSNSPAASGEAVNGSDTSSKIANNNDQLSLEQSTQLETLIPKVTEAVETLKACKNYSSEESFNSFKFLSECCPTATIRRRLAEEVVQLDGGKLFPLVWKLLKGVEGRSEGDAKHRISTILLMMKGFFTNFTDASPQLCQQLGQHEAFKLLFDEFAKEFQVVEELENKMKKQQFNASLGILHNCIRLWHDNKTLYREADAVPLLTKYVRSDHPLTNKAKCLLTLAYIVDEEESGNLATQDGSVTYLLDLLKKAVATSDHMIDCGDVTFSVDELLNGLILIAVNDANKVKIVDAGGVPVLSDILGQDFSQEERTIAARGLWRLAFVASNKEVIKNRRNILQVLGAFRTSQVSSVREAGAGALWEITQKEQEAASPGSPEGHVMISYQWEVQETMTYLKEELVKAGYNVWMDVDKAEGNMLESMADAVEKASVVLVAVSEKYKLSLNCRSEASYAYRRKRPFIPIMVQEGYRPDGWLGILVAMEKYYKCYTNALIDDQLPSIIHAIGDRGRCSPSS